MPAFRSVCVRSYFGRLSGFATIGWGLTLLLVAFAPIAFSQTVPTDQVKQSETDQTEPKSADAFLNRGWTRYGRGELANALADFNQAKTLDPKSPLPYAGRAHVFIARREYDRGIHEMWEAIRLNPGDAGLNYEPSSKKELSPAALKHGDEQVRKMLRDRPAMAKHISEHDALWNWAARKFAGEDIGEFVFWDATDPKPMPSECGPSDRGAPLFIRISDHLTESGHDTLFGFEQMWFYAVFELQNIASLSAENGYVSRIKEDRISRDEYNLEVFKREERTVQRTRAFYLKVFLPWLKTHRIAQSSPHYWFCDAFWPRESENERIERWRKDDRWNYNAAWYDLECIDRECNRQDYQKMRALVDGLLSKDRELTIEQSSLARYWLGVYCHLQGDSKQAKEEWEKALSIFPSMFLAILGRGRISLDAGSVEAAIEDFNKVISIRKDCVDAYYFRAKAYQQQNNFEKAIADLNEGIRLDPSKSYLFSARGEIEHLQRDLDHAILDYSESIRLAPDDAVIWDWRGCALADKKEYEKATADFAEAIRIQPTLHTAYRDRANVEKLQRKYSESLADVREAVRLSEDWPEAQNALAWLLATCPDPKIRDGEGAVKAATKACELSKWNDWQPMDTLACALAEAGRYDDAVKRIEQTIKLAGNADEAVKKELTDRLALFKQHEPYHEK